MSSLGKIHIAHWVAKIKNLSFRSLAYALGALFVILIAVSVLFRLVTVATVAGRHITQFDIIKLDGAPPTVTKKDKIKLVADDYLYNAVLKVVDPTYDTLKVEHYTEKKYMKEKRRDQSGRYYRQVYFTEALKQRIEKYLKGGYTADYALMRFDNKYSANSLDKIYQDFVYASKSKNDTIDDIKKGTLTFSQAKQKILLDKKLRGKSGELATSGVFSTLGPSDASQEQEDISADLIKGHPILIANNIFSVDGLESVQGFKIPGQTLFYKISKAFSPQNKTLDQFMNEQKRKYGYEV